MGATRYPFAAFPAGWFEVAPRAALRRCARCAATSSCSAWTAALHVLDAHRPHQGTHLGHGGVVFGETVRCPFHGWRFDASGRCVEVPAC